MAKKSTFGPFWILVQSNNDHWWQEINFGKGQLVCVFFIYLTVYCSNWHKKGDDWTSVGRFQTSNICIVCIEGDPRRIVNLKENRLEEDIAAVRSHAVIFSTKLRFTNPRKTSIATFSAKEVTQWSIGLLSCRTKRRLALPEEEARKSGSLIALCAWVE